MDLTWGIDVSKWQGVIDWPAVERSGLAQFAAVRTTIGVGLDERWQANLAGAADHTPLPMAYAVVGTRAAQADAADLLVNMVDRVADISRVGLVVDAENFSDGSHPTMTQVHAFRDALHRLTGRWPLAYIPGWWLTSHRYVTDAQPWPWWPSRYVDPVWSPERLAALRPPLGHGFHVEGPWQFTSSGLVGGITSRVDRNVFFGSLAELRALTLGDEDMALSAEDKQWIVQQIKTLVTVGDEPEPPTGDTHPHNLKRIRAELDQDAADILAAIDEQEVTLSDAQLDRLAAQVAAKLEIAGHPAYEITGTAVPKEATP
jgi:lysozyme